MISCLFLIAELDLEESKRSQPTVAGIKGGVSGRCQCAGAGATSMPLNLPESNRRPR